MAKKTDTRPPISVPKGTLKRVVKLLFSDYPVHLTVVLLCLLFTAVSSTMPAIFMGQTVTLVAASSGSSFPCCASMRSLWLAPLPIIG